MKFILSYIFVFLLGSTTLFSQTKNDETIQKARTLINEKQYAKAENLLSNYYPSHSDDLETNWLYAQVLHWNNKNNLSEEKFQKAIALSPKNTAIQLDYARMLYESGRFTKAQGLLVLLKENEDTKAESLLMEAHIFFWTGKVNEAKRTINEIKKLYPTTDITNDLFKNIVEATSPYLKTNFEYQSDNQPMKFFGEKFELGQYRSWLFNPKLEITNYNFTPTEQALTAKLCNQLYFASLGLSTNLSVGIYKNFSEKTDWIGGIDFNLKIVKNTSLKLGYNKKPYLGTLTSTTFNLTQNTIFGDLDYENNKLFSVHAGYNNQFFSDKNAIQSFSSWVISKPFKLSDLKIQFGYGFSYSDAKNNLYTSKQTLTDAISNFNPNETIDGYYNPYFTPKNQMVNSALVLLDYQPSKLFEIGIKANYGFAAKCQNPYIYLQNDGIGNSVFATNFSPTSFNPYEVSGTITHPISSKFEIKATFTHQETFFYNRNNASLGLNYRF